ncbi:hypothetical protein [Atlanticothrix silvestris]|uniref:hypothetical protein n=1 Tax=Atlanticothrix silvestris TaxID=2840444 RepID=UPI00298EF6CC|nr:hypothetical protein [Atlanticothrix silvestris]
MEPVTLTAVATAIATIVLTKALEKTGEKLGVQAAFELSWEELAEDDQLLGCVLSLFASAPIPWKLVQQCLKEKDEDELEDIRDDKLLKI